MPKAAISSPPVLREGDRLTAAEFGRWEAMPDLKHAELLGGVVLLSASYTPGLRVGGGSASTMDEEDVPQPDIALRILPEHDGAPELVVEISGSSSSRDLGVKLELYRRSGAREYLTILLKPNRVIWRELVRGRYKEIAPEEGGLLRSRIFPGLWLDPAAVWNSKRSLRTAVEQGVRSPEHAAFVRRLASGRSK